MEDPDNYNTAMDYLVSKLGFDPSDEDERDQALSWYVSLDLIELIVDGDFEISNYICMMHANIQPYEFLACTEAAVSGKPQGPAEDVMFLA